MDLNRLYLIGPIEGFSTEFSKLVSMMNFARATTLQEVHGLTVEELDFRLSPNSNSIAMILAHLAAVESCYQIETFQNRDLTQEEIDFHSPALMLGEGAEIIKGESIDYYLEKLSEVRAKTLSTF